MTVPDSYVRVVGEVRDIDDAPLTISVDYDSVTIGVGILTLRFGATAMEALMRALVAACWEASANAERMRQEAGVDT